MQNMNCKLIHTTDKGRQYYVSDCGKVFSISNGGKMKMLKPSLSNGYELVYIGEGKSKHKRIHRLVADAFCEKRDENHNIVDHIDGNPLNNDATNLRWCSPKENSRNMKKRENSSSKYKGVHWCVGRQKFRLQIRFDNKNIQVGYFHKEEEAARAYDLKALELYGQFAKLNFPTSDYVSHSFDEIEKIHKEIQTLVEKINMNLQKLKI